MRLTHKYCYMIKDTREFPFESGKLLKIIKITNTSFSVCKLYELIGHKLKKRCRITTIFVPGNIFISQEIYNRLFNYYISWGHTEDEVVEKLSILGPKVSNLLSGNEVAVSNTFMAFDVDWTGKVKGTEEEDDL